jgi:uncharacterized membrane protein HdeD (DUF308 family)
MASDDYHDGPAGPFTASSWQATVILGVLSVILGVIVSLHPTGSLNVLAVLIGILMILSGITHLVRIFDGDQGNPVWLGLAGLLFIVIGVIMIRHLHLTRALIGLIIGITWIVQGVTALIAGLGGGADRVGSGWAIVFGGVSLIAGIVLAATPASSLTVLAVLVGIWSIVMGLFQIAAGFLLRRAIRSSRPPVSDASGAAGRPRSATGPER